MDTVAECIVANLCYRIGNSDGFDTWTICKQSTGHNSCTILNGNVLQTIAVIKGTVLIAVGVFINICIH